MLQPKEVFDQFEAHLAHFCATDDAEVEGQYFDRKEACRARDHGNVAKTDLDKLRENINECVSAFANTNQLGGLLILGIAKDGTVYGIDHLSDQQRMSLTNFRGALRNQSAQAKSVTVTTNGTEKILLLIYTPYTPDAICETVEANARAWRRNDAKNDLLDDRSKDQLRRDKRIIDFESSIACTYDPHDTDEGVLKEIRATWPTLAGTTLDDTDLLYQLGAIRKDNDGIFFTKAGVLFFAANPQRVMPTASIRLLRYDCSVNDAEAHRGQPTLDKYFSGPLTKQIRDFRSLARESSLFKVFQVRRPDGGFDSQPEFPEVAVDEAVINAVGHRDYAENWCIECLYFRDAFVVRNAGRLIQRNEAVPEHFSLTEQRLTHTPRNPRLFDWLKQMRTPQGAEFVRALSEGTRTMKMAMEALSLPSPRFDIAPAETVVTLLSEPDRRLTPLGATEEAISTEFTNLFPLQFRRQGSPVTTQKVERDRRHEFLATLKDALVAREWFIDSMKFGQLTAHRQGDYRATIPAVDACVRLCPAYTFALRDFFDRACLCIDYTLELKNVLKASQLFQHLGPEDIVDRSAIARIDAWQRGRIIAADSQWVTLRSFDADRTDRVASANVIPDLPLFLIKRILAARNIRFDLSKAIKQHSLSAMTGASRLRAEWTQALADELSRTVFPLRVFGAEAVLVAKPLQLVRDERAANGLQVRNLDEPKVEFARHQETPDVRDGITRFGAYGDQNREIEIIPVVQEQHRNQMASLIDRLKTGRYKYRGSERTFHTRFSYRSIVTTAQPGDVLAECRRLLTDNPAWVGDVLLPRVFLVHTPESGFSLDDVASPYFATKRFLLESGIPCQMIDTPTLENADWKDLNLALNLVAKCGVAPWVLPEGVPDADFFIGLSYTSGRGRGSPRLMGYANVFNQYGRWLFYAGNTQTFDYEQRTARMSDLVGQTLRRMDRQLSETPNVYFHYSARFSREDKQAILNAARSVRPNGVYTFVWINTHHPVRLYDSRPETDGSLARGSYVIGASNQIFVSTTGYNPYRKAMGTPLMLEVNAYRSHPPESPAAPVDPKALAMQVLSLTKLNWSSTDSLCGEPITTKYAGDIAYLTASFLRQTGSFQLHPALEPTPWFI